MDNKKIKIKSNYFSKVKGRIKDLMIIKEDSMFLGHPVRPRGNINLFLKRRAYQMDLRNQLEYHLEQMSYMFQ